MVKQIILFSTLFSAFSAVAGNACDIGQQVIMGETSSALVNTRGKQNQPILTALTRRVGIDSDSRYGRYIPELVSQNNFEAQTIYFAKASGSDEVAVVVYNTAYVMTEGSGFGSFEKSPGLNTLYLDIDEDLVTINSDNSEGMFGESEKLAMSVDGISDDTEAFAQLPKEPGNFVCKLQAPNGLDQVQNWQLLSTAFRVPYSVWGHVYASGGKINFGLPARSLRYPMGD